jgi:Amt family ammonium transporter
MIKRAMLAFGLTGALLTSSGLSWAEPVAATDSGATVTATIPDVPALASEPMATAPADDMTAAAAPTTAEITPVDAAPAAPTTTEAPAAEAPKVDRGDTAWMLIATALVLMMTIPGIALFYGGMVRKKNVLGTMMHSLSAAAVATIVWVVIGYSIAFGNGASDGLIPYIGGLDRVMLSGVAVDQLWTDAAGTAYTIPETLFMVFQMTFAIITVAIMAGAFAERMKFSAFLTFIALWVVAVYAPIAHWVWHAKGWLFAAGALDFAGGTVVHINSGIAGLVAAYVIGRRVGLGREPMAPHNLVLTVIGAGMLWVGWFGFNAGSWLGADGRSAMAMVVTQVAAAAASLSWLAAERVVRGRASVLGGVSGAVAGLVVITPASGYVGVSGALAMGVLGGVICFWGTTGLKRLLKADDSLDAFGLHGIGGIVGALLTAFFASEAITGGVPVVLPLAKQLWVQLEGVLATIVYSGVVTFILLKIVDVVVGLRVSEEEEREGLDVSQHGERVE